MEPAQLELIGMSWYKYDNHMLSINTLVFVPRVIIQNFHIQLYP